MPRSAIRFLRAPFLSIAVMTVAALTVPAVTAQASPSSAFWVTPAGARDCPSSGYTTIQAAVSAAESYEGAHRYGAVPVVDICPGTYSEQVTVTKSLVLTRAPVRPGLGPVTIELPAGVGTSQASGLSATTCQLKDSGDGVQVPQSVIEVCAADASGGNTTGTTVTASDLTVEGDWPGSVCYDSLYDVLVEGGATLDLSGSTVEKAGAVSPLSGCQGGIGVQAGNSTTGQVGHVNLSDDTVKSYQKGGISIKGSGSTGNIDRSQIIGAGPTAATAQNGIEYVYGATGSVTNSYVSGNNYTGQGGASAAGILTFGGCGSATVNNTRFTGDRLVGNDMGIALANYDSACAKSAPTRTGDVACYNVIQNSNGYPGGKASADANVTGLSQSPAVGYQAGVADTGNRDVICDNAVSGPGYAPLGSTSSLPKGTPPAFVRPVDIVSGPAISPQVYGNTFDGRPYRPA
jgi:hypothetical protein